MFARDARPARRVGTRLLVDRLEARDVPATWMNYAADNDANNPSNWAYDPGESPGSVSSLHFSGACTDDCVGLSGSVGSVDIGLYYTGHVVLGGPLTAMWLSQMNGTIDQPLGAGSPITVTMWWNWVGGTLNSTPTPSSFTLNGGFASLQPNVTTGSVATADTLNIINGATATIYSGTYTFTAGDGINVVNSSASCQPAAPPPNPLGPPQQGSVTRLTGSGQVTLTNSTFPFVDNVESDQPLWNNGGYVSFSGSYAIFRGQARDPVNNTVPAGYSVVQTSGTLVLADGSSLTTANPMLLTAGKLATSAIQGEQTKTATITGDIVDTGADVVVNDTAVNGPGVMGHVFGVLKVTGNVTWTGGTYRPYVDATQGSQIADLWQVSGTMVVNGRSAGPATGAKFGPVLMNAPPAGVIGRSWMVVTTGRGLSVQTGGLDPGFDLLNQWAFDINQTKDGYVRGR